MSRFSWIEFHFINQIQDGEDSASENNLGGSSSSLSTLDALEKQVESPLPLQVQETVFLHSGFQIL